jgi:hypothetical protein
MREGSSQILARPTCSAIRPQHESIPIRPVSLLPNRTVKGFHSPLCRYMHSTALSRAPNTRTVDYLLADVGEGITECEIIKW